MTGVQIPIDAAPAGYVPNPHTAKINAAFELLRSEKQTNIGWQEIGIKDGMKMEKKTSSNDSSPIPTVRCRGRVKNMSPTALLATISLVSVRPCWDDRYVTGGLLERYDRYTNKYYSVQKGAGLFVSERDVVGVQAVVVPEGGSSSGFEIIQTSVDGDPENSGRVRATITCGGWSVVSIGDDLEIVYVNNMNPNGKIPSAIVSKIVEGLPTIVSKVITFIQTSGHPPFISNSSFSSQLRTETFDFEGKKHTIKLIAGDQEDDISITVHPKPFGGNWKIQALGEGNLIVNKQSETSAVVHIPARSGKVEVQIMAV